MNDEQKRQFRELLLLCGHMKDEGSRNRIVEDLPENIRNSIRRNEQTNIDVANILDRCLAYRDGVNALIEILYHYEKDSLAMTEILNFRAGLSTDQPNKPNQSVTLPDLPISSGNLDEDTWSIIISLGMFVVVLMVLFGRGSIDFWSWFK